MSFARSGTIYIVPVCFCSPSDGPTFLRNPVAIYLPSAIPYLWTSEPTSPRGYFPRPCASDQWHVGYLCILLVTKKELSFFSTANIFACKTLYLSWHVPYSSDLTSSCSHHSKLRSVQISNQIEGPWPL